MTHATMCADRSVGAILAQDRPFWHTPNHSIFHLAYSLSVTIGSRIYGASAYLTDGRDDVGQTGRQGQDVGGMKTHV